MSGLPRLNLGLAIPTLDLGGPEKTFFAIIRDLNRERFTVTLFVSRVGGHYYDLLPPDVRVVEVPGLRSRWPLVRVLSFARAVNRSGVDLCLVTHRVVSTALISYPLLRKAKLVVRQDNLVSGKLRSNASLTGLKGLVARMKGRIYGNAIAVVGLTEDVCADLAQHVPAFVPMVVIGNPIDLAETRRLAEERPDGAERRPYPNFVSVGRLHTQKGHDLLIRAFAGVHRQYPEARLTIVGDGPDAEILRQLAVETGVSEQVRFAGRVSNPFPLISRADAFVLASRYEGFGHVFLEALACGVPLITTRCPGNIAKELNATGTVGYLVDTESVAQLEQAMVAMVTHGRTFKTRLMQGEANNLLKNYLPEVIVGRYELLFATLQRASA